MPNSMISLISLIVSSLIHFSSISWHFNHPISQELLAKHTISLEKRYQNPFVNDVFKDNILLDIAYITGQIHKGENVSWNAIDKPFHKNITISPQETFAFHDALLPDYKGKPIEIAPAHFTSEEGFKNDGYLTGDGVCHLASLMYWTAKDAKLAAYAPIRHDFAPIPQIPKSYGVAIFSDSSDMQTSEKQNLYITNSYSAPIVITLDYNGKDLQVSITKQKQT